MQLARSEDELAALCLIRVRDMFYDMEPEEYNMQFESCCRVALASEFSGEISVNIL